MLFAPAAVQHVAPQTQKCQREKVLFWYIQRLKNRRLRKRRVHRDDLIELHAAALSDGLSQTLLQRPSELVVNRPGQKHLYQYNVWRPRATRIALGRYRSCCFLSGAEQHRCEKHQHGPPLALQHNELFGEFAEIKPKLTRPMTPSHGVTPSVDFTHADKKT